MRERVPFAGGQIKSLTVGLPEQRVGRRRNGLLAGYLAEGPLDLPVLFPMGTGMGKFSLCQRNSLLSEGWIPISNETQTPFLGIIGLWFEKVLYHIFSEKQLMFC